MPVKAAESRRNQAYRAAAKYVEAARHVSPIKSRLRRGGDGRCVGDRMAPAVVVVAYKLLSAGI